MEARGDRPRLPRGARTAGMLRLKRKGTSHGAARLLCLSAAALAVLARNVPAGAQTSSSSPTEDQKRLSAIETRLNEMRQAYEGRISALEKEIAALRSQLGSPSAGVNPPAVAAAPQTVPAPAAEKTQAQKDLEASLAKELGAAPTTEGTQTSPPSAPWSPAQPITIAGGGKNYLNLSFDTLVAAGTSTSPDVSAIETGGHDPAQRGFTVQNVETVLEGAVDPYFRGQGNIVLQLDSAGETTIELEEAYLTTTSLPHNLQVKAGMYFSEFGRLNAQHPHSWDFVDQPLVNARFLGPDGLRNPGVRASWLMPTRFYSELFLSVQDAQGGTAASFNDVPDDVQFGRTLQKRTPRSLGDLLYVPHWSGSFDVSATQTIVLGTSAALGPNATGRDTSTRIYGADVFWKWKPTNAQASFPFVKVQAEAMSRRYEAGAAAEDLDADGTVDATLPQETLRDWGAYSQVQWGFRRGWIGGVRVDYVSRNDVASDPSQSLGARWRVSPDLTWFPTEYSKLRLQWNHDRLGSPDRLAEKTEDSLWLQFEFLLGAHAAHKF